MTVFVFIAQEAELERSRLQLQDVQRERDALRQQVRADSSDPQTSRRCPVEAHLPQRDIGGHRSNMCLSDSRESDVVKQVN